jgi:hypothetical protein
MEINNLPVAAHTLHRNISTKAPPLFHTHTLAACPEGLDWDGVSCDLIIEEDISDDVNSEASHWSNIGWQTLVFMLLASLVVMVTSLAVRARTAANKLTSLESTPKYILRDNCKVNSRRIFRIPLVNRVEDLVVQT